MDAEAYQRAFLRLLESPEYRSNPWYRQQLAFMESVTQDRPKVAVNKTSAVGVSETAVTLFKASIAMTELTTATQPMDYLDPLLGVGTVTPRELDRRFLVERAQKPDKRPYWRKLERRRKGS